LGSSQSPKSIIESMAITDRIDFLPSFISPPQLFFHT
jgi:hypothetical protein